MQTAKLYFTILLLLTANLLQAQRLEGVWSGKISRSTSNYGGVEGLEIQLYQAGKSIWGYTFCYKDTTRYVLYRANGKRNKKTKTVQLQEAGSPFYQLPIDYYPCEKKYELNYFEVGNTQYLIGNWGGIGVGMDTSCFPGEDLLVVLQKLKKPDYPLESFVKTKLINYYTRQYKEVPNINLPVVTTPAVTPPPTTPTAADKVPEQPAAPVPVNPLLAERRQDIQQIIKLRDTLMRIYLYDNAIVDDDTVTLFINKQPVLVKQRLSDKALIFETKANTSGAPMEILMQAENLGSIPPNTALMLIECGSNRYEIRLSASMDKHAVVVATYAPPD